MSTTPQVHNREYLLDAVMRRYFDAMDAGDVETCVGCFADDAVLITERHMQLEGKDAIRDFFQRLAGNAIEMVHEVTNLVIDPDQGKAAAELHYANRRREGRDLDMQNCNFFDFDEQGKFKRVKFWLGDPDQFK